MQGNSRGNLCHQAACEVLQTKNVAEDLGTKASCSPDDLQPSVQTENIMASNVLRLSSLLCADFFISKEFCMAFRMILIDLYLTYKLVLKQHYDGDLPHQSMLKGD